MAGNVHLFSGAAVSHNPNLNCDLCGSVGSIVNDKLYGMRITRDWNTLKLGNSDLSIKSL